ncbi:MAG: cyclic nucleotide-binding domain-containing protein [Acidobacteriota bacterium]
MFKKLFGSGGNKEKLEQELDVDDLIALERYGEAAERLKERTKSHPNDLHSHLKLASVYQAQGQNLKAVDEFVYVADELADDGFYDKGLALLAKAIRMAPGDSSITERVDRLENLKRLEHSRSFAIEGLLRQNLQGKEGGTMQGTSVIEAQMLWANLQETTVVQRFAPDQIKRLLSAMEIHRVRPREILEEAGSTTEAVYLIVSGQIEALVEKTGGLTQLRSFGAGDFIGESTLFERKPWPTHYRATEACTLMRLDRPGLETALQGNPDPRAFIDQIRAQHFDRDVRQAVEALQAGA